MQDRNVAGDDAIIYKTTAANHTAAQEYTCLLYTSTEIEAIIEEEYQNVLLDQATVEDAMASAKSRSDALLG